MRKAIWRLQAIAEPKRPLVPGGPLLAEAIRCARPLAAGKIGFTELLALNHFLKRDAALTKNRKPEPYPRYAFETLYINSGVFPQQDEFYDKFGAIYRNAVSDMDILVSWELQGEYKIFNSLGRRATLVPWGAVDPFLSDKPWSEALQGKRVLVVSPFAASIQKQYARRTSIWQDPRVLPEFTLLTILPPFSAGLVPPKHPDWIAALNDLKAQMDAQNYDVALIGAGAFSLPLATHAKQHGKVGIHMGGTLQVLFGVYGNRWKDNKAFHQYINENWVRPSPSETPDTVQKNENACYW
ncbi:hypothetical protein [Methylocapsa acidiphila]|uniref:hypothetical protein n=1 Tax=Methylocapsa acidiphila TaxID=133552 RepID=UPI000688E330|nr:hypothetical protein [Methylocapsa acidiphila]